MGSIEDDAENAGCFIINRGCRISRMSSALGPRRRGPPSSGPRPA